MNVNLSDLSFGGSSDLVTPTSPNFRPPKWPPPREWPVVLDENGEVVSRWGDSHWDLTYWSNTSTKLNFGDGELGQAKPLDAVNANLMRMIATWLIWGPRASSSMNSVLVTFSTLKQVVALCSLNGISAANLMRFPSVLECVPAVIAPSKYETTIAILHRLYDARDALGFIFVDPIGLRRLAAAAPTHEEVQTPYMPPRIWLYQVKRLHECLTDFHDHRDQVDACFRFCLDAYVKNFGSLEAALLPGKTSSKTPFNLSCTRRNNLTYQGKFFETAERFGISELLSKWIEWNKKDLPIKVFSAYMSLVSYAGLAYIANFTLQRKEELASLRTNCLLWDEDEELGRVAIICGETTKTDPDSDARWVASSSVEVAIQAVSTIAHLRMICDRANPLILPTAMDINAPYLLSSATEPWGAALGKASSYNVRPRLADLGRCSAYYPLLFDQEQLRITEEDLALALRLTHNLSPKDFSVGKVWPLNWHQYRRTGAVNMFASGDISDSTMQQQMKHSSRLMPLYYGRNHTRLRLNKKVEMTVIMAMYQAQFALVKQAAVDERFVSPHSQDHRKAFAANVLSAKDVKALIVMAKKGTISFREHRLGGCMKAGVCEYGGIESVARCAGGAIGKPCIDVLYDRTKEPQIRADILRVTDEIKRLSSGHPRYHALVAEQIAMESYLNVISAR